MPQNTGLVTITSISIGTSNGPRQVVNATQTPNLQLTVNMTIDQSLIGKGFRWDINWRIVEVATNHFQFNNWSSQDFGYPQMVDQSFANGPGNYSWILENSIGNFGIHSGGGQNAEGSGAGMYYLQVFLVIDTSEYTQNLYVANGGSQWAISDPLFFWCE
ncbi:MAG: hypothetical protein WB817_13415 [Terriglobales bacterium]